MDDLSVLKGRSIEHVSEPGAPLPFIVASNGNPEEDITAYLHIDWKRTPAILRSQVADQVKAFELTAAEIAQQFADKQAQIDAAKADLAEFDKKYPNAKDEVDAIVAAAEVKP